ncbi:LysR family transcriptional regulator [Helcococcus kunzii]|uniref:LysR family transcriptional regulator n=1 Tax=Helcococcus kunzii TaxID=40091 RepID=UPI0038A73762
MNTDDLITFIKASELLNFSKTAEELNYSQSTITIQIKKLENEFGVQLFNRIGKNLSLTPAGEQLLTHAHNIINTVKKAKSDMGSPSSEDKRVRIGCIDSICNYYIPNMLAKMAEKNLDININITTGSIKKLFELLDKNIIDFVYIFDKSTYSEKWVKVFDIKEQLNFVTSIESLQEKDHQIHDILDNHFYLTEKMDNYRHALDQKLAEYNIEISPILEVSNTDIIINLLQKKKGISFLPRFVYNRCLDETNIKIININDFELEMSRQLFYHKAKFLTNEMKEVIKLLKEI